MVLRGIDGGRKCRYAYAGANKRLYDAGAEADCVRLSISLRAEAQPEMVSIQEDLFEPSLPRL